MQFVLSLLILLPLALQAFTLLEVATLTELQNDWQPSGWTGNVSCSWPGINCGAAQAHVLELDLSGQGLTGTIPDSINNLLSLELLYLEDNLFNGTIPQSLGDIVNLTQIDLHQNNFNGTIPTTLGQLTKLESMDLEINQLTGPIPDELQTVATLAYLYVSENQLSGTLPQWICNVSHYEVDINDFDCPLPVCCVSCGPCFNVTTAPPTTTVDVTFVAISPTPAPAVIISNDTIITTNVVINGSISITSSATITLPITSSGSIATISATGCVNITGGTVIITLDDSNSAANVILVTSGSNCLQGQFGQVLAQTAKCRFDRTKQQYSSSSSLGVFLPSDGENCNSSNKKLKIIIIASVVGAIILVAVTVTLILLLCKKIPRRIWRDESEERSSGPYVM